MEETQRIIQEYVPGGKQITLAHIIARPKQEVYEKMGGLSDEYKSAIGILTITPSEGTIIAADVATKAAEVEIGFIDRFNGTLIIMGGTVASVQASIEEVLDMFANTLHFSTTSITKS